MHKDLKQANKKAGIIKLVTLYWLKHRYAIHLLESVTDLRFIQELLDHKHSITREIYTHKAHTICKKLRARSMIYNQNAPLDMEESDKTIALYI
jgi:site-specific recombinase XerD